MRVLWPVSLTQRETITLSLDYGAALSPPGSLWSTRRLDNSILVRADRRVIRAHTMENLKPKVCNNYVWCPVVAASGQQRKPYKTL